MHKEPLVSVIMPVLNGRDTIGDAIASLQAQTHAHWELLVVDNGSTDGTVDLLADLQDTRIKVLLEPQGGVARARNKALAAMEGDYFCFLDADDLLPPNSIAARAALLDVRPEVHFVDGRIITFDHRTGQVISDRAPRFTGPPYEALFDMSGPCFFGLTWMIRRMPGIDYRFPEHMTNSEDHAFYLGIARQGTYTWVDEPVLRYRKGRSSATSRNERVHAGYRDLYAHMQRSDPPPDDALLRKAWKGIRRIMCRSYLKEGRPWNALKAWCEAPPKPMIEQQ